MTLYPKYSRPRESSLARYKYRCCPYATSDCSNRVPAIERTPHVVTSGNMSLDTRDGHGGMGFTCLDPTCPFYLGTATTVLTMDIRNTRITSSGNLVVDIIPVPIAICSGTHFFEM